MRFYKATVMLKNVDPNEVFSDPTVNKRRRNQQFNFNTEIFNEALHGKGCCFLCCSGENGTVCGIIDVDAGDPEKLLRRFLKSLGLDADVTGVEEVTLQTLRRHLTVANCNNFISDDDEILAQFELYRLCRSPIGENLLDDHADREALADKADALLAGGTLLPELDRIYAGSKNKHAFGHPVHYFLETDNVDTRGELSRALLAALYANGRIKNRRYGLFNINPGKEVPPFLFDEFYKSAEGGAIVLRWQADPDDDGEDDCATGEMAIIELVCETMLKYRNQVLTVFCLPRTCEKLKRLFTESLGSLAMVTIKEDQADPARAQEYLKGLCREQHIRPDKALLSRLEDDHLYLPDELRAFFDEWYNVKMMTSVFPQYKDMEISRREATRTVARGNAYDELNEMIGLSEAKAVIRKALNFYKINRLYKDKGIRQDRPAMHMVFTGNPGTAKTTVARLFARIMRENGLLSKGHLVEVGRGDLVGKFVGWTAKTVREKFKVAMGGVLFIDEAYSLVDDRSGSFGDEAINTIVQEMENHREDLVVIFAGYPEEMEGFLNKNPGLRSRIAFHVPFADYNADELCGIARLIGKQKNLTFTDSAFARLHDVFEAACTRADFGNGRFVRNLIELSAMNQADRILDMDPDEVSTRMLTTLEAVDIAEPLRAPEPVTHPIGFAS